MRRRAEKLRWVVGTKVATPGVSFHAACMLSSIRKFLLLAWLLTGITWSVQAADRPNFVILLCDDLGYGDLGCFGHPHIASPNLDKLARQGIRLTDCYASSPVCSASRAGLLTGRTPNRTGVYDWIPENHVMHLGRNEVTIATLLRNAGYDTAHTGKWHLNGFFNSPKQPQPGDHGFNHWFATQNNALPSHENPTNFVRDAREVGPLKGFSSQLVADEAIKWLKEGRDKSKPFFLNVWFHEPHEPVASPKDLVAKYLPVAKNEDQAQFFANVENVDKAVGRIMAVLDEMKLAKNTLVYFTSDNGPETLLRYKGAKRSYGSPGILRGMKLHIYEGGIRVPGIIRWTGKVRAGQVVDTPVCSLDLLPTFCELARVPLPQDRKLDGTSFAPLLAGKSFNRPQPLFWDYYRALSEPKVAMREGDWKIVAHWDGPEKPIGGNVNGKSMAAIKSAKLTKMELYNLKDDPSEKNDLAAQEPARLKQMTARIKGKYADVTKEGPVWDVPDDYRPNVKK